MYSVIKFFVLLWSAFFISVSFVFKQSKKVQRYLCKNIHLKYLLVRKQQQLKIPCLYYRAKKIFPRSIISLTKLSDLNALSHRPQLASSTARILIYHRRKNTDVTNLLKITMASLFSSVTVSQHLQYLVNDLETEAATWNSGVIDLIIYTCALPDVSC